MRAVIFCMLASPFKFIWGSLPDTINDHEDLGRIVVGFSLIVTAFSFWLAALYPETPLYVFLGIGLLGGFALMVTAGLILLGIFRINDWNESRPSHYTEHKTRRLVSAYVEAKHNKVCPTICFAEPVHWDKDGAQDNDTDCK